MRPSRKIALSGLLTALCFVLSYLEFLLPTGGFSLPGVKFGLANICVLFAMYKLGPGYAAGINSARIALSWLFFGSFTAMVYSFSGAVLSFLAEYLLIKTKKFTPVGVSAFGGVMHNFGQIIAAAAFLGPGAFGYLPALVVWGALAGGLNGAILAALMKKVRI